jgi:putative flippase GtrA
VFDEARRRGCLLLGYPVNRGKGYALKAGFRCLAEEFDTAEFGTAELGGEDVVCADSDGQHSVVDILAVAERVRTGRRPVLGVRAFTGAVPLRSKVGNAASRMLFAMASGCDLRDTQTGLRGYPGSMLPWLCAVPGDRFEYEMNVLLHAGHSGYQVEELTIATIYIGQNKSSHFRPVVDSIRVLTPLLRFSASGLLAFVVDLFVVLAVHGLTDALLPAVVAARAVSSAVNFLVNRRVFAGRQPRPWRAAAVRYWILVGALLAANYLAIATLTGWGLSLLPAKLLTDLALFGVSYLAQRHLVFARPDRRVPDASTVDLITPGRR